MPCRDYYDDECCSTQSEVQEKDDKINYLDAIICAMVNELSRRNILIEVMSSAEKNGKIDIKSWIAEHQKKDIERIKAKLEKFSNDEIQLMKTLIRDNLI